MSNEEPGSSPERREASVLVDLSRVAWDNFERRRVYQWKVNLALWGALGAGLLLVHSKKFSGIRQSWWATGILFVCCVVVFCLQRRWLSDAEKRHRLDKDIAMHFESLAMEHLSVEFTEKILAAKEEILGGTEKILGGTEESQADQVKKQADQVSNCRNWSRPMELGISVVLMLLLLLPIFLPSEDGCNCGPEANPAEPEERLDNAESTETAQDLSSSTGGPSVSPPPVRPGEQTDPDPPQGIGGDQ